MLVYNHFELVDYLERVYILQLVLQSHLFLWQMILIFYQWNHNNTLLYMFPSLLHLSHLYSFLLLHNLFYIFYLLLLLDKLSELLLSHFHFELQVLLLLVQVNYSLQYLYYLHILRLFLLHLL
ncbi:hypothetical protein D3C71_1434640 [compost metagenome]